MTKSMCNDKPRLRITDELEVSNMLDSSIAEVERPSSVWASAVVDSGLELGDDVASVVIESCSAVVAVEVVEVVEVLDMMDPALMVVSDVPLRSISM